MRVESVAEGGESLFSLVLRARLVKRGHVLQNKGETSLVGTHFSNLSSKTKVYRPLNADEMHFFLAEMSDQSCTLLF